MNRGVVRFGKIGEMYCPVCAYVLEDNVTECRECRAELDLSVIQEVEYSELLEIHNRRTEQLRKMETVSKLYAGGMSLSDALDCV